MGLHSPRRRNRILGKYLRKTTQINATEVVAICITEVNDPYLLLDRAVEQESRGTADASRRERLPYWAEVWPSAVALVRWFWENRPEPPDGETWELGCGLGLTGISLAKLGWRIHATDFVEDALVFAQANAADNQVASRYRVSYLDWHHPAGGPTACVVASDVVYERKNHLPLAQAVHQLLLPGGRFYLSDPQRPLAAHFVALLQERGYAHHVEPYLFQWKSQEHKVDIHRFDRPR